MEKHIRETVTPKEQSAKKNALTVQQRKLTKAYVRTGNKSKAGRLAGYSHRQGAHRALNKPQVQASIQEIMEKQGITDERLMKVLDDGLNADKVLGYLHNYKKEKDGKVEKVGPNEVISNEFIDTPDHPTRHKYLITGLELKKHLKIKGNGDTAILINITQEGINSKVARVNQAKERGLLAPGVN